MPSPLLSAPVVALNGLAEANIIAVPAEKFHGDGDPKRHLRRW